MVDLKKKTGKKKGNQSPIQNASTDASLFLEGFLEEATEAERRDGDAIASPLVKMLKSSLCLILRVALEMKVTLTPKPTCVRLLSSCLRMARSIQETALASLTEIIRTYIDLTKKKKKNPE